MATWVFLHAHPDDESSQTAGTMVLAHDRGDRVVNVIATDGTLGMAAEDLRKGETVADRRREELACAAGVIGIDRVEWLGYRDSGMAGWDSNHDPESFCNADLTEVTARVGAIVREEKADVLVSYDPDGGYGHPDHIMVHRVGAAVARQLGSPLRLLEGSFNRDMRARQKALAVKLGVTGQGFFDSDEPQDLRPFGSSASELRWAVDLPDEVVGRKHDALACHASQTSDAGFFLSLPKQLFRAVLGIEYYREPAHPGELVHGWPLEEA
ncbi:PIG-L deacetylase family protein [Propionibacterium cyclohexanicum]|nr:PIG-L family deacetylase [Propionibacterium cyclohexanicum]